MLAVSFARRDRAAASAVLSDALGIAVVLGCGLAAALYVAAPAALAAIAGEASREVIAPALSYVRIRCDPTALAGQEHTCLLRLTPQLYSCCVVKTQAVAKHCACVWCAGRAASMMLSFQWQ